MNEPRTVEVKKYDYQMLDFIGSKVFRTKKDETDDGLKIEKAELVPEASLNAAVAEVAQDVAAEPVAEEIIAPSFSEEEMELAKKLAKEEGIREGIAQANEQFDKAATEAQTKANDLLGKINSQLPLLAKSLSENYENIQKASINLAHRISKKTLGEKQAEAIAEEIETEIRDALKKISDKDGLKLVVNSELFEQFEGKFNDIELAADEAILPTDFKIEWQNGFAQKKTDVIWEEIDQIIETGEIKQKKVTEEIMAEAEEEIPQEFSVDAGDTEITEEVEENNKQAEIIENTENKE